MWAEDKLEEKRKYIFEDALLHYVRAAEELKDKATKSDMLNTGYPNLPVVNSAL